MGFRITVEPKIFENLMNLYYLQNFSLQNFNGSHDVCMWLRGFVKFFSANIQIKAFCKNFVLYVSSNIIGPPCWIAELSPIAS